MRVGITVGIFYSNKTVVGKKGGIHGCTGDAERLNELFTDIERIAQQTSGAHQQEQHIDIPPVVILQFIVRLAS